MESNEFMRLGGENAIFEFTTYMDEKITGIAYSEVEGNIWKYYVIPFSKLQELNSSRETTEEKMDWIVLECTGPSFIYQPMEWFI